MKLLLLLLLLGACHALQPGLEYQYKYSARVATGIPDINRQFAAAGIQADVTVQMQADHTTVIQLSNVEVGELNKVLDCDLRAPVPIEYHPLQEHAELLETPFRIAVKESGVPDIMESPDEPVWISNIRKSIANVFRIPVIWEPETYASRLNFGLKEDIMVGYCQNWYTSLKLPVHQADEVNYKREQVMEDDVQRDRYSGSYTTKSKTSKTSKTSSKTSKTSKTNPGQYSSNVPPLEDTLWRVTRTTDFDFCDGLVAIEIHGTRSAKDSIRRSSVGHYLLRGDKHKRIEQVIVEGNIGIITNKDQNEHVDTFTNQTLELKAVRELRDPIRIDYDVRPHYCWHYDIEHPQADEFIPLEQAITGRPITDEITNSIMEFVKTTINDLATRMSKQPYEAANLSYLLGRLVESIANLDYAHIDTLYKQIESEGNTLKKNIIKEAIIHAGTDPAVSYAVDKMKDRSIPDPYGIVDDFYDILPKNIRSPAAIPKIMDLVMDDGDSMTHYAGLMNFATLAHKACLSPDKNHFYSDFSCNPHSVCQPEPIIDTFIPYLAEGLSNDDVWRKLMHIQALSNLGTPQTIEILKPIILGITDRNVFVRTNAIWSLSAFNQHQTTISQIYGILMPIMENAGEQFEIRNIAFLTMVTWGPVDSFWQQMALGTWHDPSPQFASFVSSTISSIAHSNSRLSEFARRVEHLTKPATMSLIHSTNIFLHEYLFSEEQGDKYNFAWFASVHGAIPEEVFLRVQEDFFYGYVHMTKIDLQQRGADAIWNLIKQTIQKTPKKSSGSAQEIVAEIWEELKEKMGIESVAPEPTLKMWLKINRVINTIISQVPGQGFFPISGHDKDILTLMEMPFYNRDLNALIALPTDIGIPFSATYIFESAHWLKITEPLEVSHSPRKFKANVHFVLDSSAEVFLEARTYLPWSKNPGVASGVFQEYSLLLPVNAHASIDTQTQELQISVEPTTTSKFKVFHFESVPYTVLENNYPNDVIIKENEYKTIYHTDVPIHHNVHQVFPADVGLWVEVSESGDIKFPPTFHKIITSCFIGDMPYDAWEQTVVIDPSLSNTKTISFTFNYVSSGSSAPVTQVDDYEGQFTQERGGSDVEFGGQVHQSTDFQDISEVDTFSVQSVTVERIVKLQRQLIVSGGIVRTVSVFIELQGTPTRNYEASLTWAVSSSPSTRSAKLQVTLLKHPAVGVLEEPHTICLNAQVIKPKFSPFLSTEELLQVNYHSTLKADLFDGVTCEEAPVFTLEGSFDVSENSKNKIREAIEQGCKYNTFAPSIDVITSPLYDHVHASATWTPYLPENLLNMTYYVYDTVRGILVSNLETDHTTINEDSRVEIDATRRLDNGLWTFRVEKPYSVSIISDLDIPDSVGVLFTPAPLRTTLMYDFAVGRTPIACAVDDTQVRTFDGKVFSYEPSECWNALTYDTSHNEVGAILVRYTGQWEVRVIWNTESIVIDLSPNSFLVNGEEAQGTDDRYQVIHEGDSHTIVFQTGSRIKVSNRVDVLLAMNHRGYTAGLCGNFDGEPINDMVGPKGCSYSDPRIFALSWASPGEGCKSFAFRSIQREVEKYQESCNVFSYAPTGDYHDQDAYECHEWVYHEREENGYHCKSLTPVPFCKPHCNATFQATEQLEYECRYSDHKDRAEVQQQQTPFTKWAECFPKTFPLTFPAKCVP